MPVKRRSRADRLEALADALESALVEADTGVKAQLAAQYRATLNELDQLKPTEAKAGDPIDEVAARRARRRKSA
jgi:hypothetical protein